MDDEPETQIAVVRAHGAKYRAMFATCLFCVILFLSSVTVTQCQIRSTQKTNGAKSSLALRTSQDTHRVLELLLAAVSPQAQQEGDAKLVNAINQIDCNERDRLQGVIDQLISNGVLKNSTVALKACASPTAIGGK